MYINKFPIAFVFFSIASFSSAYGMEQERNSVGEIRGWLPPRLQDSAKAIYTLVEVEKKTKIQNTKENMRKDFGYSFPGISDVQKLCLAKICEIYITNQTNQKGRPFVLDLGAGHGMMSWKILLAGGHLTAIEGQEPTAQALQEKVKQAGPFLGKLRKKLKDSCVLVLNDLCQYDIIKAYKPSFYDVTWSGHIIHLFPPDQATAYVKNLYTVTRPGGYAYASVHSPCGQDGLIQYFLERKEAKEPFPGFFVGNRIHHYAYDEERHVNACTQTEWVGPFYTAPDNMSPVEAKDGFYQSTEDLEFDVDHKKKTRKSRHHCAIHVFDPEYLSSFFTGAGFEIEKAFFYGNPGTPLATVLSKEEMSGSKFAVGIVARKPIEDKK